MSFVTAMLSIVFCSIAIIGNFISIVICLQKELRKTPTFIFMSFLSTVNIIKMTTILVSVVIMQFVFESISEINTILLNVCLFIVFSKYQTSIYFIVS